MSESVEVAQASSPPQARKGFAARVMGVFMSPGETFEDIARRPTILAPLLLLFVVQATVTYLIVPAQGQDAALFTENSSFFQRLPEEQRAHRSSVPPGAGQAASRSGWAARARTR